MSKRISMDAKVFVAFIKAENEYYVMIDDDGTMCAALDVTTAKGWFENAYKRNHRRGYEAAMSAAINWMQFQPSVVQITGDTLTELIQFPAQGLKLRSIAGSLNVFKFTDQIRAHDMFEAGVRPALIKDEWL